MKNLALVFALSAILLSCNKDKGNQENQSSGGITIKGRISGTKNASLKSGTLALTDATKERQTERASGHQGVHPQHARPIPGSGREWLVFYGESPGGADRQLPG